MFPVTVQVFRNGFLLFTALSMLDLMGQTFPVLLCDYSLNMLLIKALFYILTAYHFGLRLQQKCFA